MSQENVEIVRRIYREVSSHGRAPAEVFDPEYALDLTDAKPDLGVVQGFEAAEGALREYWETFEKFRVDLQEIIDADEQRVVTAVRDGGRLKGERRRGLESLLPRLDLPRWEDRAPLLARRQAAGPEAAGLRE
jgi:hypothetical protein